MIALADLGGTLGLPPSVADPGFPRGGAPTHQGAPTYDFAKISQKLHEIERIWTPGGGRASKILLCRSATAPMTQNFMQFLVNLAKSYVGATPPQGWRVLLCGILDPPLDCLNE